MLLRIVKIYHRAYRAHVFLSDNTLPAEWYGSHGDKQSKRFCQPAKSWFTTKKVSMIGEREWSQDHGSLSYTFWSNSKRPSVLTTETGFLLSSVSPTIYQAKISYKELPGDIIATFICAQTPFVLRLVSTDSDFLIFELMGDCCVHIVQRLMYGETGVDASRS